eukprot:2852865-Prymnesium_polylepis.1
MAMGPLAGTLALTTRLLVFVGHRVPQRSSTHDADFAQVRLFSVGSSTRHTSGDGGRGPPRTTPIPPLATQTDEWTRCGAGRAPACSNAFGAPCLTRRATKY